MSNREEMVTTCDWCLQEALVQTIDQKLWHFWKIISTEEPILSSHKNICDKCKSRYEGFSIYIEMCKINTSKIDELLSTGQVKDEPSIDIKYPPLIKKEISKEVDSNSFRPAVSSGVFIERQMLAGCSNSPRNSNNYTIDKVLSAGKVKKESFINIENYLINEEDVHLFTHTDEKPFKCSHCNKSFTQLMSLNIHLRMHAGDKPFKCSHCNKKFTRLHSLNVHLRLHADEKPFKCSHCNNSFTQFRYLNRHLRTHTGKKPFKCLNCNKSFAQSNGLKYHSRVHTNDK